LSIIADGVCQVYAWGDNDHGQQGSGTTTVNRKPALVQGLDGYKISRVACGSSHSIAWCTTHTAPTVVHEPVLFFATKDPLGAGHMGTAVPIHLKTVRIIDITHDCECNIQTEMST